MWRRLSLQGRGRQKSGERRRRSSGRWRREQQQEEDWRPAECDGSADAEEAESLSVGSDGEWPRCSARAVRHEEAGETRRLLVIAAAC
jgi:hypothetical protein